jgi:predicted metalloprotease
MGTLAVLALAYFMKVDPSTLFGVAEAVSGATGGGAPSPEGPAPATSAESDTQVQFVSFVLDDTQATWRRIFQEQGLPAYQDAQLVLFTSEVQSACGPADAGVGPFYCPGDQKVYIDLGFFQELHSRFRAPGDFAQAYVLAHEIGHHVQTLMGTSRAIRAAQSADPRRRNDLQIRMELQADCYAGVWAHGTAQRNLLEVGDLEEGLSAAAAVGDDRLQREATGRVERESWTHGSSDMRMRWFTRGYQTGDMAQCDAIRAPTL